MKYLYDRGNKIAEFIYSAPDGITHKQQIEKVIDDLVMIKDRNQFVKIQIFDRKQLIMHTFADLKHIVVNQLKDWQSLLYDEFSYMVKPLQRHYQFKYADQFIFIMDEITDLKHRTNGMRTEMARTSPFTLINVLLYFKKENSNLLVHPVMKDYFLADLESLSKVTTRGELHIWAKDAAKGRPIFDGEPVYEADSILSDRERNRYRLCKNFNYYKSWGK